MSSTLITHPMLGFISTAWRRVATRCEIKKAGFLVLSFQNGVAAGRLASSMLIPSEYLEVFITSVIIDWQFKIPRTQVWTSDEICEFYIQHDKCITYFL